MAHHTVAAQSNADDLRAADDCCIVNELSVTFVDRKRGAAWVYLIGGVVILVLLLAAAIAIVVLRGRAAPPAEELPPSLDVATLVQRDLAELTRLEIYNLPMQLAAVIVAPAGRGADLPDLNTLGEALDGLSPGLADVFTSHAPTVITWPAQLSTEGFIRSFFRHVALPGNDGKGSQWCSLAGRVETQDESLLVGLVCRADRPNSLGQILVERSTKWLDIVRVRLD